MGIDAFDETLFQQVSQGLSRKEKEALKKALKERFNGKAKILHRKLKTSEAKQAYLAYISTNRV